MMNKIDQGLLFDFLKEVDASFENWQTYEALTPVGVWRPVRIVFVSHDYAQPDLIECAMISTIDLKNGASMMLYGAELPARLRKHGETEQQKITQEDIEQFLFRGIVGRACSLLTGGGWLDSYISVVQSIEQNWYGTRVSIGHLRTILQGVEILTRLRVLGLEEVEA